MRKRIGLIVDGESDFAALRTRFGYCVVLKTDGPRGHEISAEEIARTSRKQIDMLVDLGCSKIVLVTDLEQRIEKWEVFADSLNSALKELSCRTTPSAAVANKMFENWILADIGYLSTQKKYIKKGLKQKAFEGKHGKQILKRCFAKGHDYHETVHAPDLFQSIRLGNARRQSRSLDVLLVLMGV